jgi:DNA-binding response OmpR family regulator
MTKKILIVDDEPRYVRLMEANLVSDNYDVLKAYNGEQALDIVAKENPDLVLLDIMMPILDGFTTCERIRKFSTVPIIVVTVKGEEQDRVRGLDIGADDYIVKPFRFFTMATWRSTWQRQRFSSMERWSIYLPLSIGFFYS